jgi:hypothetical protein
MKTTLGLEIEIELNGQRHMHMHRIDEAQGNISVSTQFVTNFSFLETNVTCAEHEIVIQILTTY